jgi:WD40 repeat protein
MKSLFRVLIFVVISLAFVACGPSVTVTPSPSPSPTTTLSVADKEIRPLPVDPLFEWNFWWHENNDLLLYPSEDKNNLVFLDTSTMSFRQLPFTMKGPENSFNNLAWGPNGDQIALVAEDGSLWQVDFPKLENLEQLTPSLPSVAGLEWSPDGDFVALRSGSDIYIVETTSK